MGFVKHKFDGSKEREKARREAEAQRRQFELERNNQTIMANSQNAGSVTADVAVGSGVSAIDNSTRKKKQLGSASSNLGIM